MTKQEILDRFSDIDFVYNDSSKHDTLSRMLDELLKEQEAVVRCKDCKWRSYYCTEATDGTTMYECHYPCADSGPRPFDWYCADGKRRTE